MYGLVRWFTFRRGLQRMIGIFYRIDLRVLLPVMVASILLSTTPCDAAGQTGKSVIAPGCNKFGIELLKFIDSSKAFPNILISSYSISEAMNMTASGAAGATAGEVYGAIDGNKLSANDVDAAARQLRASLNSYASSDKRVDIAVANSLWVSQQIKLKPSFIEGCKQQFNALVRNVQFGTSAAVNAINDWVAQATRGKISHLIDTLDSSTAAVLVNAVYFKGLWTEPFKKQLTTDEKFYKSKTVTRTVKMMKKFEELMYGAGGDAQIVALPYGQGRMRMLVVLPSQKTDAGTFLASLSAEKFASLEALLFPQRVNLFLPKFKLAFGTYSLNAPLAKMGLKKIFGGGDFSRMCQTPSGFFVSDVLHKAIMEVDEEGTVAAAATAVAMPGAAFNPGQPAVMHVDRPFLVFIEDTDSGMLMFSGIVRDPQ